ncbi:MAG: hypothetical protein R2710_25525 [Acidimicrobiales bacterium]
MKGFTKLHPGILEDLRGTYAGLSHPVAIDHLAKLGVTAVRALPVHQFVHDNHLRKACGTTGATTRSAFSLRTTSMRRHRLPAAQCRSSSRWFARCTMQGSR